MYMLSAGVSTVGVSDKLTVNFDYFLHRVHRVGIWSLLKHLVRNGVQLKQTENNIESVSNFFWLESVALSFVSTVIAPHL